MWHFVHNKCQRRRRRRRGRVINTTKETPIALVSESLKRLRDLQSSISQAINHSMVTTAKKKQVFQPHSSTQTETI